MLADSICELTLAAVRAVAAAEDTECYGADCDSCPLYFYWVLDIFIYLVTLHDHYNKLD